MPVINGRLVTLLPGGIIVKTVDARYVIMRASAHLYGLNLYPVKNWEELEEQARAHFEASNDGHTAVPPQELLQQGIW